MQENVREWIVLSSAAAYWGGVWLRAHRLKRRLGRSPNLRPSSRKEKFLWAGWTLVVAGWAAAPFAPRRLDYETPTSLVVGTALILLGLAGTAWCHAAMGGAWRIGVKEGEKTPLVTSGPYRRMRHPIYFFQIVILSGVFLLIPSPLTLGLLVLHRLLVGIKARDEERHLENVHGPIYKEYSLKTGALWPKF